MESETIKSQQPTHILIITANDNEFNACYSYLIISIAVYRSYHIDLGLLYFDKFSPNVRVAVMGCRQGPIKAVLTVLNAARISQTKVILFVGDCATMDNKKAKLGDVIISAKLATYSHKKVDPDGNVYRGPLPEVSKNMSRLILGSSDGWTPPLNDSRLIDVHNNAVMLRSCSYEPGWPALPG